MLLAAANDLVVGMPHWIGFTTLVAVLLALDLLVFHRHDHKPTLRESAGWTVFWITLGLIFNAVVWWWGGHEVGITFLNAYVIEKSLSMDNIFIFVVIFRYFHIPIKFQYRVLFWGIFGAIIMRLVFILVGVELIRIFDWVAVLFGAFLVYTAVKLAWHDPGEDFDPEKNFILRKARKRFRVTKGDHHEHGHKFFVRDAGLLYVTPMFLVLLVIESTDVVFAVDSVPAVIGIIPKTFHHSLIMFLAFSSNVFAILGLRALYFLLAGVIQMFRYLHYGLAAILGFVGLKMIAEYAVKKFGDALVDRFGEILGDAATRYLTEHAAEGHLVPNWLSLLVIALLLTISIVVSLIASSREGKSDDTKP